MSNNYTGRSKRHRLSIRRLAGSILGISAILSTVNGIIIVKNTDQEQPAKNFKLHRPNSIDEVVKSAGITVEEIPTRLCFTGLDDQELGFLPTDVFGLICDAQLVELLDNFGLEKLLNTVAPYPRRSKKLFDQFGNNRLQPSPDLYPTLDCRIFKHFDPWTTLISGALTQEQYLTLIHYSPKDIEEDLKTKQVELLTHSLLLLKRDDLDFKEVALAIGSNANALQEAGSVLPEATNIRLNLLVKGYSEYMESQKRQSL